MNQKPGKVAYEIYSLITFIDVNFFHFEKCYEQQYMVLLKTQEGWRKMKPEWGVGGGMGPACDV